MLSKLSIDNYALIEKSVIDFQEGFTIITGETGAGKSIMLDALSLLMGSRADSKAMGDKDRKTIVEAIFKSPDNNIKSISEENSIEWDEKELIIRREIYPSGKSRGFINDTPVTLSVMSAISSSLLDIHSQHSNTLLNKPQEQLEILDAFGKTETYLNEYKEAFKNYIALRGKIKNLKDRIAKGKENEEYIKFRLEQLNKLKPKRGELEALEREAEILNDSERIKASLEEALSDLDGSGASVIKLIQSACVALDDLDFDLLDPNSEDDIKERLNSIKIELRDITDTLENYSEKISSNPERLGKVQNRIEDLYEGMKKFKVRNEDELVNLHEKLRDELANSTGVNVDISQLEIRLKELAKDLKEKADRLSESREKQALDFSHMLIKKISPLGLPNVNFKVDIQKGKMTGEGQDIVTFYCSFNKNHPLQPIAEIASGGEISRVMLGIKSMMSESMNLPTIIFDEIDTGVSGEIAHKMGKMMKDMSRNMQVMSVTHLPQVAVHGDRQLKVYKADDSEKTVSHIKELNKDERVREIAAMLSGNSINQIAMENARLLLENA